MKHTGLSAGLLALGALVALGCGDDDLHGAGGAGGTGGQGGSGGAGLGPSSCEETCPSGRVCTDEGACIVDIDPESPIEDREALLADWLAVWSFLDTRYGAFPTKPTLDWASVRDEVSAELAEAETRLSAEWIMARGVARIGDGHTGLYPNHLCSADPGFLRGWSNVGACLAEVEGRAVVIDVLSSSPLSVGDEIVALDGRPLASALDDLAAQPRCVVSVSTAAQHEEQLMHGLLFRASTDRAIELRRSGSEETITVEVTPSATPNLECDGRIGVGALTEAGAGVGYAVLPSNVLYVHLPAFYAPLGNSFAAEPVIDALRPLFEDARDRAGLILDIRSNPGGIPLVYMALASWLFDSPTELFRCRDKSGAAHDAHREPWSMTSSPDPELHYAGPLALLVGARSFSSADFTYGWVKQTGRGRTFGAPSGGGFGNGNSHTLGSAYTIGFNDILCLGLDGAPLEGNPPPIDEPVAITRADVVAGVDTVISTAEAWVLTEP